MAKNKEEKTNVMRTLEQKSPIPPFPTTPTAPSTACRWRRRRGWMPPVCSKRW